MYLDLTSPNEDCLFLKYFPSLNTSRYTHLALGRTIKVCIYTIEDHFRKKIGQFFKYVEPSMSKTKCVLMRLKRNSKKP